MFTALIPENTLLTATTTEAKISALETDPTGFQIRLLCTSYPIPLSTLSELYHHMSTVVCMLGASCDIRAAISKPSGA